MAVVARMSALSHFTRCSGVALIMFGIGARAQAEPEVRILLRREVPRAEVSGASLRLTLDGATVDPPTDGRIRLAARGDRVRVVGQTVERVVVTGPDVLVVEGHPYLGRMEVVGSQEGLTVVNRLPVETYLLGIVGSEMPAEWPLEALKAQAVAARTYALQRRLRERSTGRPWDLRDSVLSQVYRGADSIRPRVIQAVRETAGIVLTFRHEPAEALFHSTCGGHTVPSESVFGQAVPYLRGKRCDWCRDSDRYRWSVSLDRADVERLLERSGLSRGFRRLERGGEEAPVWVHDSRGRRAVPARKVRSAFGYGRLYSTRFDVDTAGRRIHLSGAGFGHRVGLCQWGARGMAQEGKSFRDILGYYYEGAELKRAY